jgi:hypothetical protein
MPYEDPNQQRAYMREKTRERRAASKRRDSLRSTPIYPPTYATQNAGIPNAVRPSVIPAQTPKSSARAQLALEYARLREAGLFDVVDQEQLCPHHREHQLADLACGQRQQRSDP